MHPVTERALAKINLSLHVLGRRADGFHELDSIVAFADVGDELVLTPAAENDLLIDGPFAAWLPLLDDNIIWKAYGHLANLMPLPRVGVQLTKNLPVAAGIGGGSADAAAMLRGLLRLVAKSLEPAQMEGLAAIGSDVPACFIGRAACMTGKGEKISVLNEQLPPAIVLVNPMVPCSTPEVFRAMGLKPGEIRMAPTKAQWRNDMMVAAIKTQPIISDVLSALQKTDLFPVLMSGSGATCFGIAKGMKEAEATAAELASRHPEWWVQAARLG